MHFEVDTGSAVPIYAQLIAQIKHGIAAGRLRPGDSLPSLRELAARLRVNPLTIAKAYRELEHQGIVITEQGRGTSVSPQAAAASGAQRQAALQAATERYLTEAYHLNATLPELHAIIDERWSAFIAPIPESTSREEESRV